MLVAVTVAVTVTVAVAVTVTVTVTVALFPYLCKPHGCMSFLLVGLGLASKTQADVVC